MLPPYSPTQSTGVRMRRLPWRNGTPILAASASAGRMKLLARAGLACLTAVCVTAVSAAAPPPEQRIAPGDFALTDVQAGTVLQLSDYHNRVVVVNFWASWCPPCVQELPSMRRLKARLENRPFEILAINMGESRQALTRFAATLEQPVNFPLLLDETMQVAGNWQVRGLPMSFIIDKQGRIADVIVGPKDWSGDAIRNQIDAFIAE